MHRSPPSQNYQINIDSIIEKLNGNSFETKSFPLSIKQITALCYNSKPIFAEQPILLELEAPFKVCGDIHGHFKDLLYIFEECGNPNTTNYLFLGDYVDRGKQSLQCFCLLLAYKIKHPDNFFILRGNHECSELNRIYGFYDQCKRRLDVKIWKVISDVFNYLPVAAIISNRIFCTHGGLSPQLNHLSFLNELKRPFEIMSQAIVRDMLWADPKTSITGWEENIQRGVSYYFGSNVVQSFLNRHCFDLICRSHQVVEEGYEFAFDRKILTLFSAPNYCGEFTNLGAILTVDKELMCSIRQFQGLPNEKTKLKAARLRAATPIARTSLEEQMQNLQKGKSKRKATSFLAKLKIYNEENDSQKEQDHAEQSKQNKV